MATSDGFPPVLKICFVIFYSTVFVMSSVGNTWVIIKCYKGLKRQHMPLMWLVANLAFADLLFTSLTVLSVIDFFWRWVGGNGTCRPYGFLVEATYTTSIATLMLITFQRHKAVTDPFNARVQGWARKEYIKPAIAWFLCLVVCSPLLGIYRLETRGNAIVCVNTTWGDIGRQVYYSLHATFFFVLPFLYMILTQRIIHGALRARVVPTIRNSFIEKSTQRHKKVAKTLTALTISFAICWSPIMVTRTLINFHVASQGLVWRVSQLLIFLNAALDPILYGYYGENLCSMKKLIKCNFAKRRDSDLPRLFVLRTGISQQTRQNIQRRPGRASPSQNMMLQPLWKALFFKDMHVFFVCCFFFWCLFQVFVLAETGLWCGSLTG